MKHSVLKSLYLLPLLFSLLAVSCSDDFPYRDPSIPEGEGTLSATVTFTPVTTSELGASRTPGDAINSIESLCVLVYDKNKELFKKFSQTELLDYNDKEEYKVNPDTDHLDGNEAHTDEKTTAQATFKLPNIPFGSYYIFAVANMEDLSGYDVETVDKLQHITLEWNTSDITKNNQMFGYFTSGSMDSEGFQSKDPLTFTGKPDDSQIHAWLKRAASKVTVAFDPSGLNQGVTIYIRNVTVRDIPRTCLLGAENTPTSDAALLNHLTPPYDNPDYTKTSEAVANSRFEYNADGIITNTTENTGTEKTDGLRLDNSIRSAIPANAHATNAPSLFFYENNQNAWLEKNAPGYKENSKYNKQPQKDGDDKIGQTIHDPDNDKDFKDRVPYGTYVEVEAYYISSNPANPGEGSIKYRFMLGKDTSFDYDAQRNYHYKLTLGFNGWANDPDWHIDYITSTPDILVPPVFHVSYLYQQKSELPIKIIGDIEYLSVLIKENNWAPYDPNTATNQTINLGGMDYLIPKQTVSITGEDATYEFKWNEEAFLNSAYLNPSTNQDNKAYPDNLPAGQQRPEFGFLALHLPTRNTTAIASVTADGYGSADNANLIAYWKNNLEGERRFASDADGYQDFTVGKHPESWGDRSTTTHPNKTVTADDEYTVKSILNDNGEALENQRILMLPVWTRTKSLVGVAGFSGNNPYEAFERKATLEIRASFKGYADNPIIRTVEVYQVKRITNPKGVWRAHDRSETFNVTLLEPVNSNAESDFHAFTSQGEWTAFIDQNTNDGGFTIRPNGETNGYIRNDTIHGNTGSTINFAINFGATVGENESKCAVIKVLYHGNQCMHKILVRKGYNSPLRMGDNKQWSSFSLYQATSTGQTSGGRQVFDAVLTKNPLMLGSMFRRGRVDQGIFVWNNMQSGLGPFMAPGNQTFVLGLKRTNVTVKPGLTGDAWKNQWQTKSWSDIGYVDVATAGNTANMGLFYALDDEGHRTTDNNGNPLRYRVPTYEEFQKLTEESEFGFGVFYGSSATEPQTDHNKAYGLIDPYNEGLFDDPNGMRAVVAYDKTTGNQILFPIGRYGIGVRRMFNVGNIGGTQAQNERYRGNLHYSDVYQPLSIDANANNLYRPIPYNLPSVSGTIYWIDVLKENVRQANYLRGRSCLGWDMNYFNFDFNDYTANNYQDACPIKFVIDE